MNNRVLIIGGGLAGLAAATVLAPKGFQVTILEARPRLGGRASSFVDAATGQLVDNCQHVSMGCCTAFAHFCRTVGIDHLLAAQRVLYFMTADGRVSRWKVDALLSPFHLARSFVQAHFLTWAEKWQIARGLLAFLRMRSDDDPPFRQWLELHGQSPSTVERFWGVVLTSALNETPDRIGLRYARKVFLDAFLRNRNGATIYLPTVPLGRLYGEELQLWLQRYHVVVRLNEGVRRFHVQDGRIEAVELRNSELCRADWYICAVSHDRAALLCGTAGAQPGTAVPANALESSPITSVHLWYDRPIMKLPHVVLIGCLGQWVFNRGERPPEEHGVQVVISASRQFADMKHDEVARLIRQEIEQLFNKSLAARLTRCRVVTEHAATFSAVPNVDQLRPSQRTSIPNLFLAGDWTQTGWPATMEGAVHSGYLAAEALLRAIRFAHPGAPGRLQGHILTSGCDPM